MGKKKEKTERERWDEMLRRASPPPGCSTEIPVAPGRGPMVVHREVETVLTSNGPRQRHAAMPLGYAAWVASPLDVIELGARRDHAGRIFTKAQHHAAAEYEALFVRVNGGRVKCSNLEYTGGGGSGGVMDEILGDIQRLRRMDRAIGNGLVLVPRAASAQAGRRSVHAGDLVHWVLVKQSPLKRLLEGHGWAVQSRYLKTLQTRLATLLDAIYGL